MRKYDMEHLVAMIEYLTLIFLLLTGHCVADFALQTETMARLKNWRNKPDYIPQGQRFVPCWHYWMFAHSAIHGVAVFTAFAVAGLSTWEASLFGFGELGAHFVIDCAKTAGYTNPNSDQLLHAVSKVLYIGLIIFLLR